MKLDYDIWKDELENGPQRFRVSPFFLFAIMALGAAAWAYFANHR